MKSLDLTILIPARNEEKNLPELFEGLHHILRNMDCSYEIILIDGGSQDKTVTSARQLGAKVIIQKKRGYGGALKEGFQKARGKYILTMDADLTHYPTFIHKMWNQRDQAEVIIASRYLPGGMAKMPKNRYLLSLLLNKVYGRALSLPVHDLSSGFRLYQRAALKGIVLESINFDVLEEILIKLYIAGFSIREVPFYYSPRTEGASNVRLLPFAISFLRTLYKMWRLRNTIEACDYDERAYDSVIPLQRYWQRKRHDIIVKSAFKLDFVLDIGCGSSQILNTLPHVVGMDVELKKLRYIRRYHHPLACGSIFSLPFRDFSFDGVICSEVIEHVPFNLSIWSEMYRVLKPGGTLIVGTPDYSSKTWLILERLYKWITPGGYGDEHITHYTPKSLKHILKKHGFVFQKQLSILDSEIIMVYKKQ